MRINVHNQSSRFRAPRNHGSVLVIVLWVALGLVAITLYFAHSMTNELRASDNRVAGIEAEQAIEGATLYASLIISNSFYTDRGLVPDVTTYRCEAIPLGDAHFWFLGRTDQQQGIAINQDIPYYGLIDECSKLNLNTATLEMLEMLPRMTPEMAAAIIDWRDGDSEISQGGAEAETYQRQPQPYACKNAPFDSVDELRLVFNSSTELLYGEDANLNGILDPNENDAHASLPDDNHDGRLDAGLLEYVTVYSMEPNTRSDGTQRINISSQTQRQQQLQPYLQEKFSQQRANEIISQSGSGTIGSLLEFYSLSKMTPEEFGQIEPDITTFSTAYATGLVNVCTAPAEVLACVPGIGVDYAMSLVNFRQSNPARMTSIAWVAEVLQGTNATAAGPWITARSYQYTADIAAVGHYGRGYRRTRFVLDATGTTPAIIHRQDLTHLGWALGSTVRRTLLTQNYR